MELHGTEISKPEPTNACLSNVGVANAWISAARGRPPVEAAF
jgi:hypothetical protein